jgi:hypothetical protein
LVPPPPTTLGVEVQGQLHLATATTTNTAIATATTATATQVGHKPLAKEAFQRVTEAAEVLADEKARRWGFILLKILKLP